MSALDRLVQLQAKKKKKKKKKRGQRDLLNLKGENCEISVCLDTCMSQCMSLSLDNIAEVNL